MSFSSAVVDRAESLEGGERRVCLGVSTVAPNVTGVSAGGAIVAGGLCGVGVGVCVKGEAGDEGGYSRCRASRQLRAWRRRRGKSDRRWFRRSGRAWP